MVSEITISQFRGTPLHALAQNANVNGGETLTKIEFAIMQQQMKNLGLTFEEYGLTITSVDSEGSNSRKTRENIAQTGSDLSKAYKKQFGNQNSVKVAQTAELKADAVIKTALDMFKSEHTDVIFVPKSLGARPQFTEPQYKNNPSLYAMDLSDWANGVKIEYMNATKLSNEALAAMILDNNNQQTAILSSEMLALANSISEEIEAGTAEVIKAVKNAEGHIVKTIKNAEGHIVQVIQDNAGKIINIVREESVNTRNTVRKVGADVINDNRFQHAVTNNLIINNHKQTRNVIRGEAYQQRQLTKKTARESQQLEAMNIAIAERVEAVTLTTGWPSLSKRVGDMQKQISQARIPHNKKMELLQRIRNQLAEIYTSDDELDEIQVIIDKTIAKYKGMISISDIPPALETPEQADTPPQYHPYYEFPQEEESNKTVKNDIKYTEPVKDECKVTNETRTEKEVTKQVNKVLKK